MSVIYSTPLKTARMQDVADLINSKTIASATGAGSTGLLVIGTSALSGATGVLASIVLPNPMGSVSGAVLTFLGTPLSVAASATGTPAKAELRNNSGTVIASGLTVGLTGSGANVELDSLSITAGQTVTITSGTLTHG